MAGEQHGLADLGDRGAEVGVVLGDAPAKIRMLARPQRTAVLAQVEGVEGIALGGEALGHVALKKIVGETVDVEHRATGRLAAGQAH